MLSGVTDFEGTIPICSCAINFHVVCFGSQLDFAAAEWISHQRGNHSLLGAELVGIFIYFSSLVFKIVKFT